MGYGFRITVFEPADSNEECIECGQPCVEAFLHKTHVVAGSDYVFGLAPVLAQDIGACFRVVLHVVQNFGCGVFFLRSD